MLRLRVLPVDLLRRHFSTTVLLRSHTSIDKSLADTLVQEHKLSDEVTVRGKEVPEPVYSFDKTGFPEEIVKRLQEKYEKPSMIQSVSWPVAMAGRDLISVAKTGSGKTLGFILPGIVHTMNVPRRPPGGGPSVLVLAPTRELAQQVHDVTLQYAPLLNRNTACLFGGAPKALQEVQLRHGADICIATPGRLLDHLATGSTNLGRCTYLVLDEADRMLDMGFEPQIRQVVTQIKTNRQTLMFSATWPEEVRELANDFQFDPVFLNVGSLQLAANHNIAQKVLVVPKYEKERRLFDQLRDMLKQPNAKVLVFCQTKQTVDYLANGLSNSGIPAHSIHGGKTQLRRDTVMNEFRNGRVPVLLATDVAARGLDVQDIQVVINYDFPTTIENYVHRIGRTGRQDKSGTAITFLTHQEACYARELIKILEEAKQEVPVELRNLASSDAANLGPVSFQQRGMRPSPGSKSDFYGYGNNQQKSYQKRGSFEQRNSYNRSSSSYKKNYGW